MANFNHLTGRDQSQLMQLLGRARSVEELVDATGVSEVKVGDALRLLREPVSVNARVGEDGKVLRRPRGVLHRSVASPSPSARRLRVSGPATRERGVTLSELSHRKENEASTRPANWSHPANPGRLKSSGPSPTKSTTRKSNHSVSWRSVAARSTD